MGAGERPPPPGTSSWRSTPSSYRHQHPSTSAVNVRPAESSTAAFRIVAFAGGFLVLVILALIAYSTISKAWPAFRDEGLSYFTSDVWDPANAAFGTLAFSFGTVVISVIALFCRGAGEHRHRPLRHRARPAVDAASGRDADRPARRGPVGRLRPLGAARARSRAPRLLPGLARPLRRRPGARQTSSTATRSRARRS